MSFYTDSTTGFITICTIWVNMFLSKHPKQIYLALLCDLFGQVKWPFQNPDAPCIEYLPTFTRSLSQRWILWKKVKWPPTIGDEKVTAWITWLAACFLSAFFVDLRSKAWVMPWFTSFGRHWRGWSSSYRQSWMGGLFTYMNGWFLSLNIARVGKYTIHGFYGMP